VTLKRVDFDTLLRSVEDAADLAAVDAHRTYEDRVGWEEARRNYLTSDETRRLLDGESPVRVWREKRSMKQRTLAEAAEIAASYLAEIEAGKKPGSSGALQRIAGVLEVPLESLVGAGTSSSGLRPVSRAGIAAKQLITRAESGAGPDGVAKEVHTNVDEWRRIAERGGVQHQVKAAIETLIRRLVDAMNEFSTEADAMERGGKSQAARQKRSVARSLGAGYDAAVDEYHKH
jgi:transcriptional regulator with XRE-family HTH domain